MIYNSEGGNKAILETVFIRLTAMQNEDTSHSFNQDTSTL